ncbi:hypothetical protein RsS62_06140 [Rhizobium dioscoreae]|nr:hypothetical protein RsS62_06140 [Rhizobium dioscoreae]
MKDHIDGEDPAEFSFANQVTDEAHGLRVPVGKVHLHQAVRLPGRRNRLFDFGSGAAQRLLAKDGNALFKSSNGLLCVQGAGGGNDDPIERFGEQIIEARYDLALPGKFCSCSCHLRRWVADERPSDQPGVQDSLHAVPANPADT